MVDPELKKKAESVLFAVGKKIELQEIARLVGTRDHTTLISALEELQKEYEISDRSFNLQRDGTQWKLMVRERYTPVISKIVTQTELTKTVMETLAVIAYKAPLLQSDVIKIRTNKAYDHLVELEKMGYITRKKKGRTKEIRLAEKFFEYFDVPPDRLKDKFRTVKELEDAVALKEQEIAQRKSDLKEKIATAKESEDKQKQETMQEINLIDEGIGNLPIVELVDDAGKTTPLQTVNEVEVYKETALGTTQLEIDEEKLGNLKVVRTKTKPEQGEPEFLGEMQVYERKKRGKKAAEPGTAGAQGTQSAAAKGSAETAQEVPIPVSEVAPEKPTGPEAPSLFGDQPPKEIADIIERRAKELMQKVDEMERESEEAKAEEESQKEAKKETQENTPETK